MEEPVFLRQRASSPGWARIEVSGELDIAAVPELDRALSEAVSPTGHHRLILDLGGVTFIDCAAVGRLTRARRALGDRFLLASVPPAVTRLFRLAGLTDAFAVHDGDPSRRPAPGWPSDDPDCSQCGGPTRTAISPGGTRPATALTVCLACGGAQRTRL